MALRAAKGALFAPYTTHRFLVHVEQTAMAFTLGSFMSVTGLSTTIDTEDVPEGGNNAYVHKLPKGVTFTNVVLKRGILDQYALWDWMEATTGWGMAESRNALDRGVCAITLLSSVKVPIRSWVLNGAFPVRWAGSDFTADSSTVATEELEIAHDGFYVVDIP
jgi:phage tail-like protein